MPSKKASKKKKKESSPGGGSKDGLKVKLKLKRPAASPDEAAAAPASAPKKSKSKKKKQEPTGKRKVAKKKPNAPKIWREEGAEKMPPADVAAALGGTKVEKDVATRCVRLLELIMDMEGADVFEEPVPRDVYPQYYEMIERPMDLGTAMDKLKKGQYASLAEFSEEVKLTFSNCCIFNDPASLICATARDLDAAFDGLMEAWILSPSRPVLKRMTARNAAAMQTTEEELQRRKKKAKVEKKKAPPKQTKEEREEAMRLPQGVAKAGAKKKVHEIYFRAGRLGEDPFAEEDDDEEEEDEEEQLREDDLVLLERGGVDEARQSVVLPTQSACRMPPKLAAVALAAWDFTLSMRRRILHVHPEVIRNWNFAYLTCSWDDFEYALMHPSEPGTAALLLHMMRTLMELAILDLSDHLKNKVDTAMNAMTMPSVLRTMLEKAAKEQLKTTGDPEPFAALATEVSTKDVEDFSLETWVAIFDALTLLVVDTPSVRNFITAVEEREEEIRIEETNEARSMLTTATKEIKLARRIAKQEAAVAAVSRKALPRTATTKASVQRQMNYAMDAVLNLKEGPRSRSEMFMHLPSKYTLPEYYKIVKRPISLFSIRERLRTGRIYTSWSQFREDIELAFSNARLFNQPDSEIFKDASILEEHFNAACPKEGSSDAAGGIAVNVQVRVKPEEVARAATEADGRVPFNETREACLGKEGVVAEAEKGLIQVRFGELVIGGVTQANRVIAFPTSALEIVEESDEPVPIETRAQTAARIKTEAAVKYDEMREESGSMRREILGLDRHHRRYFVLGDDFSRIFCGTETEQLEMDGTLAEHAPVCIHTQDELDALIDSLMPEGERESRLLLSLRKIRSRCGTAMAERAAQDQRYSAGLNVAARPLERWKDPAAYLEHLPTRCSARLEQIQTNPRTRQSIYDDWMRDYKQAHPDAEGESADKDAPDAQAGDEVSTEETAVAKSEAAGKTDAEQSDSAPPSRLLRLKQEMLAMEAAIPNTSQSRMGLSTEQQRREWAFKVLGTDRTAELSDLLLEFSGNVHRDWLDKEWKPWKELTSSSDMTKEEQQAAIASGMMEDPEEIRKEQERKKLEEEERKRKAIEALPAPWTEKEDADLTELVKQDGLGGWIQKSVLHNAKGYNRSPNALRHRFAQVIAKTLPQEVLDALRPEQGQINIDGDDAVCFACKTGKHVKHTCGKAKPLFTLSKTQEEGEGGGEQEAASNGEGPAGENRKEDALTAFSAAVAQKPEEDAAAAKAKEEEATAKATEEEDARKRLEAEEAAKAEEQERKRLEAEEAAKAKKAQEEAEEEQRKRAAEEAAANEASDQPDGMDVVEDGDEAGRRSSSRGRKEPERFEAGAAPPVVGTGESVVRKKEGSLALMDVDEEDKGWAPTPEAKVTSTAEVFAHLWKLDQALKYSYRGKRTLRKPEEQRRLRDQMLDMWRTLQTVVDDTPFSDDEDDDGSKHPDAPPPLEEGARVEVMEAFGGAWVGQQGVVLSRDSGYVRCQFDNDDRVKNLRVMHLKVIPTLPPPGEWKPSPTPQLIEFYRDKCLDHELVRWYTKDPKGYVDPRPEPVFRKRADIFMVLPTRKELPYYYRIIKHPIDLTMIKDRILADRYTDMWQLKGDMTLMFDNARVFNSEDSLVYEDANVMQERFEELLSEAGLGDVSSEDELQLHVGVELEIKWLGQDEWLACTVIAIEGANIDIHYPRTATREEFEETLLREEMVKDRVRGRSRASRMLPPKIGPDVSELYEEAEKQDKEVDVEAMTVTGLPKPERPRLPSERHEMMMQVWEAVRHVGDANGRDRGIGFCRLPPRREADYYNKIQRPLHLMRVRGMIEKQRFHDVATFEVDMSTVFRNARQFYGPETQVYIDALILEEVFWAALQAVEKGETYSVPPNWIYTAYPKYKNRAPESEDEEKEERTAKARERGNFVWLDISIPPGISPGTVCKVVDGDAREHYIKIPPLDKMVKADASAEERAKVFAALADAEKREKEAAAAEKEAAAVAAEKEADTTNKEADTTEKEPVAAEKEPAAVEDAPAKTEKEEATAEKALVKTEKDGDAADQQAAGGDDDDGDAGAGYVFRKRLPRLYNQDCLENLDEEELHHWLSSRDLDYTAAMGKPALISKAVAYLRNPRQRKPVLPAFWDCEWSSEYDRWYYVNEKTNVTTWEVPTKPAEGPAEKAKLEAGTAADRETGPVSINHVTEGRLAHVLSTNMADAIVKARDQGPFASLADCTSRVRALGKAKQRDLLANQILFPPDDKDCPGVAAASNGGVKREREDGDDESGATKRAKS